MGEKTKSKRCHVVTPPFFTLKSTCNATCNHRGDL